MRHRCEMDKLRITYYLGTLQPHTQKPLRRRLQRRTKGVFLGNHLWLSWSDGPPKRKTRFKAEPRLACPKSSFRNQRRGRCDGVRRGRKENKRPSPLSNRQASKQVSERHAHTHTYTRLAGHLTNQTVSSLPRPHTPSSNSAHPYFRRGPEIVYRVFKSGWRRTSRTQRKSDEMGDWTKEPRDISLHPSTPPLGAKGEPLPAPSTKKEE